MSNHDEQRQGRYQLRQVGDLWHLRRPGASMEHAFDSLDDALAYARRDSNAPATFVEIMAGGTYMVKRLDKAI